MYISPTVEITAVGYFLRNLGIPDDILRKLETARPLKELEQMHDICLVSKLDNRDMLDRLLECVDESFNSGRAAHAMEILAEILRNFSGHFELYHTPPGEALIVSLRLDILRYLETWANTPLKTS